MPKPDELQCCPLGQREAFENGAKVAVCSTSNEKAVKGIVRTNLPEFADRMPVYAGDMVEKKKPAPDVYLLAAKELGVDPVGLGSPTSSDWSTLYH